MTAQASSHSRLVSASPVYYGWIVWMVALVGVICSAPGQSFSVSLFIDFFIEDFGLDRTTVSGLYGAGTFIASLSLTWVGRQLDRWGNRRMGTAIGAIFAVVLLLFSLIGGPIMLMFAFAGIRGLGQGALTLVGSTAVANWFRFRRGTMMAMLALVFALFQGVYVILLRVLLETMDWRQVFVVLGVAVAALVIPAFALLMRDKPEQFGMTPDFASSSDRKSEYAMLAVEDNWTLREALRTPMLWIFVFARMLPSAWGTGLILHQVSIFAVLNHSARVATETYALISLFAAGSALFAGYLIDRIKPAYVVALQMIALLFASLVAMMMRETWLLVLFALAFGLGLGIGYVFDGAVWPNLFGRQYQGEIRGFVYTVSVIGSAIGPALFGLSYDYAGGYEPVLWLGAGLCAVVLVTSLLAPAPRRTPVEAT
jgi:MFS family permease